MNVNKVIIIFGLILLQACQQNSENRWDIAVEPIQDSLTIKDVSVSYYNPAKSNANLKAEFPEFFQQSSDSLLTARRQDSISHALHKKVNANFTHAAVKDSLHDIFSRVRHYYPGFQVPNVYLFTGELDYQTPVIYYPESRDLIIGLDWFLGEDNPVYEPLGVLSYFKQVLNPQNFKPKVVESLADRMVKYDIRKRKFIEKMIYEGKKLVVQDALLPHLADNYKIGYTPQQLAWSKDNEANIYRYFTENEIFFSDDKSLDARFLDKAPFSKFYGENDRESAPQVGVWLGWQICRAYLNKNEGVSLQAFLANENLEEIFTKSGYKPVK